LVQPHIFLLSGAKALNRRNVLRMRIHLLFQKHPFLGYLTREPCEKPIFYQYNVFCMFPKVIIEKEISGPHPDLRNIDHTLPRETAPYKTPIVPGRKDKSNHPNPHILDTCPWHRKPPDY